MSVKKKSIEYAAAAIVVSLAIVAASVLYMGFPVSPNQSNSSIQGSQPGTLAIWLTDPPQVPSHTSSLNLTYSSLGLLVGEPTGTQGQLDTKSITVTPTGGPVTLDLLKLQNVSQTIALASLPSGSVLYSVAFAVSSISIDVNGTVSPVQLATGGTTFLVTIAHPSGFTTGDYALLQLNPVVVNTPSGYQLIPSSVGVMGHGEGNDGVGHQHQLSNGDNNELNNARGNVSSSITAFSVAGNVTTITVLVNNSANIPVDLNGIGIHGNFTVFGSVCQTFGRQTDGHGDGSNGQSQQNLLHCMIPEHMNEVVFVPLTPSGTSSSTTTTTSATTTTTTTTTSTTTSGGCATAQMGLVSAMSEDHDYRGYTLGAGQCVKLTFSGKISFGEAPFVLVPSTSAGQVYILHVIASNGANMLVSCTLPLGATSCAPLHQQQDSQDW